MKDFFLKLIKKILGIENLTLDFDSPIEKTPYGLMVSWDKRINPSDKDKTFYYGQLDTRITSTIGCLKNLGFDKIDQKIVKEYRVFIVPKKFECPSKDHFSCSGYFDVNYLNKGKILILKLGNKSQPFPLYEHELAHVYGALASDHSNQNKLTFCI